MIEPLGVRRSVPIADMFHDGTEDIGKPSSLEGIVNDEIQSVEVFYVSSRK